MYNVFIDEFAERVSAIPARMSDVPAILFADDVLLSAKSPEGLRRLMDVSTTWAEDRGMTWNTKKGKSEVLESEETKGHVFNLARKELNQVKEVTYLGVSLSEEGITDSRMLERIKKGKNSNLTAKSARGLLARAKCNEKPSSL